MKADSIKSQRDGLAGWLLIQVMNDSCKVRILVRQTICSCCSVAMTEILNESWFQRGRVALSDFRGCGSQLFIQLCSI